MHIEHPNISLIKRFDPANPVSLKEVLAEDFVWHYLNPKLPELEGDYYGISGLTYFFKMIAGRTNGSFNVKPLSVTPMGDELLITHVKDTMSINGKPMEIDAIVIWCILNGLIKEAWDIPIIIQQKLSKL